MLAISLGLGVGGGVLLFKTALNDNSDDMLKSKIEVLKVEFLNPGKTSYIRLNVNLENEQQIQKILSIKEQQHQPLTEYLKAEGFVSGGPIKEWIPLQIDASQFTKGGDVNYIWDADGKIGFLSVDEYPIIGKMPTVFKKIILVILGIIFIVSGTFLFIIGLMGSYQEYKIYKKTGVLPEQRNMITDMK